MEDERISSLDYELKNVMTMGMILWNFWATYMLEKMIDCFFDRKRSI